MTVLKKYRRHFRRLAVRAVCLLWVVIAVWGVAYVPQAAADSNMGPGSEKAAAIMRERAGNELDRMAGKGTSDFAGGAADGSVGKAKRSLGRLTNDADTSLDGAGDQLKGKVKRDVGRLKGKAADLGDDLENAAEDAADSVKGFFN